MNEKQEEPDYKSKIKKRAQQSSGLRQHLYENANQEEKKKSSE